jgi:CheY-like chemotaxis protein
MATVLVIGDNPGLLELLCRTLEEAGHRAEATDSSGGLASCRRLAPDLALYDLAPAGLDALGILAALCRALPPARVVAIAGRDSGGLLDAARAHGAAEALSRPFRRRELLDAVGRALTACPAASCGGAPSGWGGWRPSAGASPPSGDASSSSAPSTVRAARQPRG